MHLGERRSHEYQNQTGYKRLKLLTIDNCRKNRGQNAMVISQIRTSETHIITRKPIELIEAKCEVFTMKEEPYQNEIKFSDSGPTFQERVQLILRHRIKGEGLPWNKK